MLLALSMTTALCGFAAVWIALRRRREWKRLPDLLEELSDRAVLAIDANGQLRSLGSRAQELLGVEGRCDPFDLDALPVQGLEARIFASISPDLSDARSLEPCFLWSAGGRQEVDVDVIATRPKRGPMPAVVAISPVRRVNFTLDADFDREIVASLEASLDSHAGDLSVGSFDKGAIDEGVAAPVSTTAPESPLQGLRVLLAEDGPDNQLLMSYILLGLGVDLVLVENGEEAVARAMAESFDLILLDLAMPLLDGFQAARAIRKVRESSVLVAVSARDGVEEECHVAGFDAVLPKPLRRRQLVTCVEQLGIEAKSRELEFGAASEASLGEMSDEAALEALMLDPEFAALVREFRETVPERVDAMRAALDAEDWELLESLAHQLKGASGGFGMVDVSLASGRIEDLVREDPSGSSCVEALAGLERVALR